MLLTRIPVLARKKFFFIDNGYIIPKGTRCCLEHLEANYFKPGITVNKVSGECFLNAEEINELLNGVRSFASRRGLDFDTTGALTNDDYWNLTGVTINQFNSMLESVQNRLRNTLNRNTRTCLAIVLMKIRTGLSYYVLSTLFAVSKGVQPPFVKTRSSNHDLSRT